MRKTDESLNNHRSQPKYDLFVSHAPEDTAWVRDFLIPSVGTPSTRIITDKDFDPGSVIPTEFVRAVTNSRYTLLVMSPSYLADVWATFGEDLSTYITVKQQENRLIPLLLHRCAIPLSIDFRVYLDCTDADNWEREIARLRAVLNQPAPAHARILCPYPGMVPFRTEDSRFFYGRHAEIEDVVLRLRSLDFLMVIGPSGSGKSSLISAGLLPELQGPSARYNYWAPHHWSIVTMRPGPQPLCALHSALGSNSRQLALAVAKQLSEHGSAQQLLLVVDQFEEIFTQATRTEQDDFIAALRALWALDTCKVIMTMRADFYPDLMNSNLWPLPNGIRVEIAPLRGDALRAAIQQPATDVGVQLESGLVERLVADAANEPGSLPLLQETLILLWGQMQSRVLSLRAYERLGSEGRTGLAVALATKADATLANLGSKEQAIARRVFLRLIQFGEGRPPTRRQQPLSALRAVGDDSVMFEQTVATLTSHRLLTLSGNETNVDKRVDLAHEALIGGWPTLHDWLKERQEAEQIRRRLEAKAAEWRSLGSGNSGLLDEGQLPEAERWLAGEDALELGYTEDLVALIEASKAAIVYAHEKELEQARALARQLRVARAQSLAANSLVQLEHDPELSVLLAMEAVAVTQGLGEAVVPQAEEALHLALTRSPLRLTLRGHDAPLNTAAYSPDGRFIVTTGQDGVAKIWDAKTGQERLSLSGHEGRIWSAEYSSDGNFVLTSGRDGTARIWNAQTGKQLRVLEGHTDELNWAAYSPNGKRVVTASDDHKAIIWEAATGEIMHVLQGHSRRLWGVRFSPDGNYVATASCDWDVKIWDANTGQEFMTLRGHKDEANNVTFSPDGKCVLTCSDDDSAKIWDSTTGQVLMDLQVHGDNVWRAEYSPDGRSIVTASWDGTAKVWDAETGQERLTLRGHTAPVGSAVYSPDGCNIVTASRDKTARIWAAQTGQILPNLQGHSGGVVSATYGPDNLTLLTRDEIGVVRVWNSLTAQNVWQLCSDGNPVRSVAYSPDGRHLATAGKGRTVRVWAVGSRQEVRRLSGHTAEVRCVAYSPDGLLLVTASKDRSARVWHAQTGRAIHCLTGHTRALSSAAFSTDGHLIVTASQDGTAKLWSTATGEQIMTLVCQSGPLSGAAFSPGGDTIITTSKQKTAKVWNARNGDEIMALHGHSGPVLSAAFSTDGQLIVTASQDGTAKLWSTATGEQIITLRGHSDAVRCAAFSRDGRYVVTGSNDGTARQHMIRVEDLLLLASTRVTRGLTAEERATYLGEIQPALRQTRTRSSPDT